MNIYQFCISFSKYPHMYDFLLWVCSKFFPQMMQGRVQFCPSCKWKCSSILTLYHRCTHKCIVCKCIICKCIVFYKLYFLNEIEKKMLPMQSALAPPIISSFDKADHIAELKREKMKIWKNELNTDSRTPVVDENLLLNIFYEGKYTWSSISYSELAGNATVHLKFCGQNTFKIYHLL